MTVREIYKIIQERFPDSKGGLNLLAWPLHQPLMEIQYVDKNGNRLGDLVEKPIDFLFAEPLAGPFYDLTVVGINVVKSGYNKKHSKWKYIRLIVLKPDGEFTLSSVISLLIKMPILKGLATDWGIDWYHVQDDWPWKYTRLPSFDDCEKYDKQAINKGSI